MRTVKGTLRKGSGDFTRRMTHFPDVFKDATGESLFPGTLNVQVHEQIKIREHFRIRGVDINEPEQDLLFEICRINGIWAYRIRPYNLQNGSGGHGDRILEIACSVELRKEANFDESAIEIALFG
jgi:CTP-dependent riboflavin kinase